MRITFVLPDANMGGGTRVIAAYAIHLKQFGHDVTVVSSPLHQSRVRLRTKVKLFLTGKGWPIIPRRIPSHFDGLDIELRILEKGRPVVDSDVPDADVVVATWWETSEWVHRLSPAKGAKASFIQQYEANFGLPEGPIAAIWRLPIQKIVCSRWLADLARDRFDDPTAIVCTNDSVDTELFRAPPRDRNVIPTVGLLYVPLRSKGPDIAFAAIAQARRTFLNLKLVAFGMGPSDPAYPIPEDTEYTRDPPQASLRDIYAKCDVFVCASRSEGFTLPFMEAMACRCPVVSTRVGGPMDLIRDGVEGYVVDVDAAALASRIVDVLSLDGPGWRRMSDEALATARRTTWADATRKFEQALMATVKRSGRELATSRG